MGEQSFFVLLSRSYVLFISSLTCLMIYPYVVLLILFFHSLFLSNASLLRFCTPPPPTFILKQLAFWLLPSFWFVLERSELRYNVTRVCSQPVCRDTAVSLYQRTVA
jgi:hypothetical protein